MEQQGWIKIHRKIQYSEVFKDPNLLKLFMICLLKAAHKRKDVVIEGINNPIRLEPGQFIAGRFALHSDFYHKKTSSQRRVNTELSPVTLWRKLKVLEKLQILIIKSCNKYSIITVLNWNQYQQNDQQMINKRSTDDQQMITNKNGKEVYICEFFSVNEKQHEKYSQAYPKVDLIKEYKKMESWLESNPTKRKTEKGYPRFINSWLAGADKDRGDSPDWRDKLEPI